MTCWRSQCLAAKMNSPSCRGMRNLPYNLIRRAISLEVSLGVLSVLVDTNWKEHRVCTTSASHICQGMHACLHHAWATHSRQFASCRWWRLNEESCIARCCCRSKVGAVGAYSYVCHQCLQGPTLHTQRLSCTQSHMFTSHFYGCLVVCKQMVRYTMEVCEGCVADGLMKDPPKAWTEIQKLELKPCKQQVRWGGLASGQVLLQKGVSCCATCAY